MSSSPLLEVRDLQASFVLGRRTMVAVDGVGFTVDAGETLAIVGESGSGKSVTALSVMRLLPARVGQITQGSVRLGEKDLIQLPEEEMRTIRGKEIGMIFQEPMTSLNPVHTIGAQISEVLIEHEGLSHAEARTRAIEQLEIVGISEPALRVDSYPHEMSGGMRQRAMIAMALACRPSLLIADEPTTALDVTIQAQVLDLMEELQEQLGMAIIFITHDLGVVAQMAQRVVVMYAGQVVESASVAEIFGRPRMPGSSHRFLDSVVQTESSVSGPFPATSHLFRSDLPAVGSPPDARTCNPNAGRPIHPSSKSPRGTRFAVFGGASWS